MISENKKEVVCTSFEEYKKRFFTVPENKADSIGNPSYELGVTLAREVLRKIINQQQNL